jgi:hypothetical protein
MRGPAPGTCGGECARGEIVREGLLWFDNDPGRKLEEKVQRAIRRYRQKFGRRPNVCYVHPSLLDGKKRQMGEVRVASLPSVLRHHFWVGEEEGRHV